MNWSEKYWDIVSEIYWWPAYIGLKSIPQRHWMVSDETVTIPKAMTNPAGPLYRRSLSGDKYWEYVRRQEETFNHIFDLTLSIMPGDLISELFGEFISAKAIHQYELRGHSIRDEYDWIAGGNVTTPDSFLLSKDSILAIELKFNAKTSLDQLAKYIALIVGEEIYRGKRTHLDLLYIFPSKPKEKFAQQTSINSEMLNLAHYDLLASASKNAAVKQFYATNAPAIKSALERLKINCITWTELHSRISVYMEALNESRGDRTLHSLLSGLNYEIQAHPLSKAK